MNFLYIWLKFLTAAFCTLFLVSCGLIDTQPGDESITPDSPQLEITEEEAEDPTNTFYRMREDSIEAGGTDTGNPEQSYKPGVWYCSEDGCKKCTFDGCQECDSNKENCVFVPN